MLFELRQYTTRPGRRADWVHYMEEVIVPFQVAMGMVVVGSFVGEEDPDLYVWIRRFEDEPERERLYRDVYQSERWKEEIGPKVTELIYREKIVVTRLHPTPKSVLR